MRIVTNEPLIKRNARIAQITIPVGMIAVFGGMYLMFRYPTQVTWTTVAVLVGFVLSQIGIYFSNRWGRIPRPDQQLNSALKGLDNNYTIYHYTTPTSHLLVGPAGVWLLMPRYQRGTITYSKDRWRQAGSFMLNYLKIFGQEGLGRPDLEAEGELNSLKSYFEKKMPGEEVESIQPVLIFTDERAVLDAENAPIPTIPPKKLKEMVRKAAKARLIAPEKVKRIQNVLEGEKGAVVSEEKEE